MPIKYKISVLEALKAAGYTTYLLRKKKLLAESTIQKLRTDEMVDIANIDRICRLLNRQPGDLIEYISTQSPEE